MWQVSLILQTLELYLSCPNMAEVSNSGDESVLAKSQYPNVASVPNFADSGVISRLP